MALTGRRTRQLNGKEIMELWVELDSLGRVCRYFESSGRINQRTGKPFTQNALWRAASLYMIENPDEARKLYNAAGAVFSDEHWEILVLKRATQILRNSRSTFLRWVITQDWPKKYENLYREQFAVRDDSDYDYFTQTARRMPKMGGRQFKNRTAISE